MDGACRSPAPSGSRPVCTTRPPSAAKLGLFFEVERLRQAGVVLAAVDVDAEEIGADGDAVDADHLGPAARRGSRSSCSCRSLESVDLNKRQREVEVAQHEAHRAVGLRACRSRR